MAIASNALRNGSVFEFESNVYIVLKYQHMKKGRGQAVIRLKVKNLETNAITELTFSNEQKVEDADVIRESAQFLYRDGENAYFMNSQDYSQFELQLENIEDQYLYLKEGEKVVVMYINDKPQSIELPKTVVLEITETEPAVAGNTATNAMKDAVMETGLVVKVPLFIKTGEIIKINTGSGEYISRNN